MKNDFGKKDDKNKGMNMATGTGKFLTFMDEVIDLRQKENRPGTAGNYRNTSRSFAAYLAHRGCKDVSLHKVSGELLAGYQDWMLSAGRSRNTTACHMRNLRATYNQAIRCGLLSVPLSGHPFANMLTRPSSTRKRAASPELIRQLRSLDIRAGLIAMGKDPGKKTFRKTLDDLTFARDTFIFCFFACGLPFVDFAYLTHGNLRGGFLCYERHKTGRYIEMEILPEMHSFINRYATDGGHYLFPVIRSLSTTDAYHQYVKALRKYNHKLRMLSSLLGAGISLTTYIPRHSWATTVYHHNMPVAYICERMGHTSEKTTRTYLKSFESSKIDEANKRILQSIFR
ncbi:MAG: site-specific integrase [Bacteroidaceae bacterium]|nr:site-specific integrase [Bacteroidaceae bacterium]